MIVQGNLVYDTGRDTLIKNGKPELVPPAIPICDPDRIRPSRPAGLHFSNNVLHPGQRGVSNIELKP